MSDIESLINSIGAGNASESSKVFNDILSSKIEIALNNKKIELANNTYDGMDIETDDTLSDAETETD